MITYKTMQIQVKKGHRLYPYFEEMCAYAKNMHNTTNFYIRQIFTGLSRDGALQPLQQEVFTHINKHLSRMNDTQIVAYQKKVKKERSKLPEDQKEIACKLFQEPSKERPYVDYAFLDALFKSMGQQDYRALPTQSSQGTMKNVFQNWKSFYASLREFKANPSKFHARPKIPGYSRSSKKEVTFSNQDCVIKEEKYLKFPKTKERLTIGKIGRLEGKLKQVRVLPKCGHFVVEVILQVPSEQTKKETKQRYMSVDLGIDNLATIVTNTGRRPVLVKGNRIKSINQRYNQLKARYTSILRHGKDAREGSHTSKRLEHLSNKRHHRLKDLFHKASAYVERIALEEDVDTLIIGQNKGWKHQSDMGKKNNQSFISIPHRLFIQMVTYKAERQGITVILTEESYTSQASFLDNDAIPVYGVDDTRAPFSGKRIKRGLYRSKNGTFLNADVNGAANIMRKVWKDACLVPIFDTNTMLSPVPIKLK